jgi:cytochrome P450 family 117 subfamily A
MLLNPFQRADDRRLGLPVMPGRFPFIGHLPAFLVDPIALQRHASQTLGPLFWIDLGFGRDHGITFHDEEAFGLLKSSGVESLHFYENLELFFGRALIVTDGAPHRHARSILQKPFGPGGLQRAGVARIARDAMVDRVRSWHDRPRVKILAETQEATLRVIFGIIGIRSDALSQWREQFRRFMLSALPLPFRFPGSPHWMARRARNWIDEQLRILIEQTRRDPAAEGLLAQIVHDRDDDGEGLSEQELLDNLRLLVLAGHETTASALAWLLVYLASDRRLWERLCEEASGVDEVPTTPEQLAACPFAQALFREAVRMHPPVYNETRRLTEPMTIRGHVLPTGTLVNIPLTLLSQDPQRYPDPLRFDPDRWLEREHKLTPLETCQFGGGHHFCLGYHLAVLEGVQFAIATAKELSATGRRPALRGGKVPAPVHLPLTHPPARTIIELVDA